MIAGCFVIRNHQACSQRKKQDDKELRDIEHRGAMLSATRDQHTVNCVNEQDNDLILPLPGPSGNVAQSKSSLQLEFLHYIINSTAILCAQ